VLCPGSILTSLSYKLQEIFGIIGYPKIFHTDNGKEFTAKVVLKALREMNPHICAITGRPRSPSDQGSVESMNKMVKRILGTLLTERRLAGNNGPYLVDLGFAIPNLEITYVESALEKKAYSVTAAPFIDPLQGSVLLGNCRCIGTRLQEHRVGKKHSETTYHFAGGLLV